MEHDAWTEHDDLTAVLLDKSARWDERDDAAMDLAASDEPNALAALLTVGQDQAEADVLLESVGESIAAILSRHVEWADDRIARLTPIAREAFERSSGVDPR